MVEDVEDILVDKVASDKKLGMTQVVLIVLRYWEGRVVDRGPPKNNAKYT